MTLFPKRRAGSIQPPPTREMCTQTLCYRVPPRSFSTSLPVELQLAVVDSLRSDNHALAICALVCKYWRLRSHHYTFSTVVLAWTSVVCFQNLIQNEFSATAIIPSIKAMHVRGPLATIDGQDSHKIMALSHVLSSLSSAGIINTFVLENLRWDTQPSDVPSLSLSRLSTIATLELLRTHFASKAELVTFLGNFHGLRHLVLQDVVFSHTTTSASPTIPPGSYGLALRCAENFALQRRLRWDCSTADDAVPPAELADLVDLMTGGRQQVSEILQTLGGSLHHLQLTSQTIHTHSDASLQQVGLTHTTSLKQLSLGSARRVLSLLPWLPRILAEIPSAEPPTLTMLQIAFASSRQFHLDRPFLLYIEEILSRPQFQRLQVIQFVVFNGMVDMELERVVERTVREALASWSQKGKLVFNFSKPM